MQIVGVVSNSFVDYPKKIAMALFTPGCNMNCYYCHNREYIGGKQIRRILYHPQTIISDLKRKESFLDGVVISGGEPTLQPGLIQFIRDIRKETSLFVKLDTNGTRPASLKTLLDEKLVDYIAMDIKAPTEKYSSVCLCPVDISSISESIKLIMSGNMDYEFRTTFSPDLSVEDIGEIARMINGAKHFSLQQYRKPAEYTGFYDKRLDLPAHSAEEFRVAKEYLEKCCGEVLVKGINI